MPLIDFDFHCLPLVPVVYFTMYVILFQGYVFIIKLNLKKCRLKVQFSFQNLTKKRGLDWDITFMEQGEEEG